jgi:alanine racemase
VGELSRHREPLLGELMDDQFSVDGEPDVEELVDEVPVDEELVDEATGRIMNARTNTGQFRPTAAYIDSAALTHNVAEFVREAAPSMVCAVVKADGYGHGAVTSARAALRGGATWLAVALVEEAIELRDAGVSAPILLLSEFPHGAAEAMLAYSITPTVYSFDRIAELDATAETSVGVHIKVDTGMHRVGAHTSEAVELCQAIQGTNHLSLAGTFTHFAIADAIDDPYTNGQIDRFDAVLADMRANGFDPGLTHASNTAGTVAHKRGRYSMVRAGISVYGHDPDTGLRANEHGYSLRPVLQFVTAVSHVKSLRKGDRISYGLQYEVPEDSVIATVPVGYADGVSRRLSTVGGEVLLHGRRVPMVGRVTMDQIMLNCGPVASTFAQSIQRGDEVVLLGAQGTDRISPWEWATKLDTISYEVTCAISKRVPRIVLGEVH